MPCDIELANAQLKLWDYKLLESVHTPFYSPNSKDPVTIPLYEFIYELHVLFRHERAQKVFFTCHHWNSYTL